MRLTHLFSHFCRSKVVGKLFSIIAFVVVWGTQCFADQAKTSPQVAATPTTLNLSDPQEMNWQKVRDAELERRVLPPENCPSKSTVNHSIHKLAYDVIEALTEQVSSTGTGDDNEADEEIGDAKSRVKVRLINGPTLKDSTLRPEKSKGIKVTFPF